MASEGGDGSNTSGERSRLFLKFFQSVDSSLRQIGYGNRDLIARPAAVGRGGLAEAMGPLTDLTRHLGRRGIAFGKMTPGQVSEKEVAFVRAVDAYANDVTRATKDFPTKYQRYRRLISDEIEARRRDAMAVGTGAAKIKDVDIGLAQTFLSNLKANAESFVNDEQKKFDKIDAQRQPAPAFAFPGVAYPSPSVAGMTPQQQQVVRDRAQKAFFVSAKRQADDIGRKLASVKGPFFRILSYAQDLSSADTSREIRRFTTDLASDSTMTPDEYRDRHDRMIGDLQDVVDQAQTNLENEQGGLAQPAPPLDVNKTGFGDLVELSRAFIDGRALPDRIASVASGDDVLLTDVELAAMDPSSGTLSLTFMYERLVSPLVDVLKTLAKKLVDAVSADRSIDPSVASIRPRIDVVVNLVNALQDRLSASSAEGQQPREIAQLVAELENPVVRKVMANLTVDGPNGGLGQDPDAVASRAQAAREGLPEGVGSMLFRRVDPRTVEGHLDAILRFKTAITSQPVGDLLQRHVDRLRTALGPGVSPSSPSSPSSPNPPPPPGRSPLSPPPPPPPGQSGQSGQSGGAEAGSSNDRQRVSAARSFSRAIKGSVRAFVLPHEQFIVGKGGDAFKHMQYWLDIASADKERDPKRRVVSAPVLAMLKEYAATRNELATWAASQLTKNCVEIVEQAKKSLGRTSTDGSAQLDIDRTMGDLRRWVDDQALRAEELYVRGAPSFLESFVGDAADRKVVWLYALKAVRLVIAWAALRIGTRTIYHWYSRRVYNPGTADLPPPHPAALVGLVLVLDAAMHLVVLTGLSAAMVAFKSADNDFPVDGALLAAWGYDYVVATIVIGVVAVLLAEVVRSKKYFRYKYEGTRSLHVLHDMMWWTYVTLIGLPYYRLKLF